MAIIVYNIKTEDYSIEMIIIDNSINYFVFFFNL